MNNNIDYNLIVAVAAEELRKHSDWRVAFSRYADNIIAVSDVYKEASKALKQQLPKEMGLLRIYSSIALVQKSPKSAYFDLRIYGQSVGGLMFKNGKLYLSITAKQQQNNYKHLHIETIANPPRKPYLLESKDAQMIIKIFTEYDGVGADMKSREHQYETLILHDLVQTTSTRKKITYCRPVMLGEYGFFQMRTVFAASRHQPKYAMNGRAAMGGGIDILARIQHKDGKWRLAVMELKDDNKKSESQPVVMMQAMIYATFIGYLLRDVDCGKKWWNLFRNQDDEKSIKPTIDIDVITVMPTDKTGKLPEAKMEKEIPIPGINNVSLHPYSLYVDADLEKSIIKKISGTLCSEKKS